MFHALLMDDDPLSQRCLAQVLKDEGFETSVASTLEEARNLLRDRPADVLVLDLVLPDGCGLDVLRELESRAETQAVVITGHSSVETLTQALRLGACDYLTKPLEPSRLKAVFTNLRGVLQRSRDIERLRGQTSVLGQFGEIVGASPPMQRVYDLISMVAPTEATAFIQGESGTGKELIAQAIHNLSRRKDGPFVPVNCGAIPPTLMESELFGHEKGSFTGADKAHRGCFERAQGGTLFLDEITEMPSDLQVKLLRVVETGTSVRIGGDQPIPLDVRVVTATNRAPEEAVAEGKLRKDLFYRLNVFPIPLPPLRERGFDLILLAAHFLGRLNKETGNAKKLTTSAVDRLLGHGWPGNVRELKNVIQRAYILADEVLSEEHLFDEGQALVEATGPNLILRIGSTSLADAERRLIEATLEHCQGDKRKAAGCLGVSLRTLYYRLNNLTAGGEEETPKAVGQ
jgi:DNA-binding NtrC family response regulator